MKQVFPLTWSLEEFYKGGSRSKDFQKALVGWKKQLVALKQSIKTDVATVEKWQQLNKELQQFMSYVHCLRAQNVNDEDAGVREAEIDELNAHLEIMSNLLLKELAELKEPAFQKLLCNVRGIQFSLEKSRSWHRQKMATEQENLVATLAPSGYHSWYQLYSSAAGKMRIPYKKKTISFEEADTLLDHPDRTVRKEAFQAWEKACKEQEYLFCHTLNNLAGYRLKLYEARNWSSVLHEACFYNNIEEKSLLCMWSVVEENKAPFVAFLKQKAKLLGVKKLAWYDQDAPCGSVNKKISYSTAAKSIERCFHPIVPDMAEFAMKAIKGEWIEAENRKNKAPGGFCTPFPLSSESRIFMTYADTFQSMLTLAHEIGHAYHSHVLFNGPFFAQNYPMTLAETASTFAEHLVMEGMLDAASEDEKKTILHNKVDRSVAFFMNIHARFLFEESFYKERQKGTLMGHQISDLMLKAQEKGFTNAFSEYHPYFWITKQHFHFSHLPFYNFPYTVGYLFSLALIAKAKKEPKTFAKSYVEFLQDTGTMSLEDIAKKHFQADLSKKAFWQNAINVAIEDVTRFLEVK